jgi:hypothetical protein
MIIGVLADSQAHSRGELISLAEEKYGLALYYADQRTTMAIQSLLKKDCITKVKKGLYRLSPGSQSIKTETLSAEDELRVFPHCGGAL